MLDLFYIDNHSLPLDVKRCFLHAVAIVLRKHELAGVSRILRALGGTEEMLQIAARVTPLAPMPSPGGSKITKSRVGDQFDCGGF